MRKIVFILVLCLISCNQNDEQTKVKNEIKKVLFDYYKHQFLQDKNLSNNILDSVVLVKIDSVSDKELARLKLLYLDKKFEYEKQLLDRKLEIFKLETELYGKEKHLYTSNSDELENIHAKLEKYVLKIDEVEKSLISNELDSLNFLFYKITSTLYTTENNTTEKKYDVFNFVTKSFKIKELDKEIDKEVE